MRWGFFPAHNAPPHPMSRWIAINCSEETEALVKRHPNAFLLLTQIAMRAKYKHCPITKLQPGQAFLGDWRLAGIRSEMAYRHAKSVLADCNLATFQGTTKGTIATLTNSTIFSISTETNNGQDDAPATSQQRVTTKTQGHSNNPPTPQGGDGQPGDSQDPPKKPRSKRMTQTEKGRTKHPELTPRMIQIGSWFGRQDDTLWSVAEAEALEAVNPPQAAIDGMEFYYSAEIDDDNDHRRTALYTLLNNWSIELDRARAYYRTHPPK